MTLPSGQSYMVVAGDTPVKMAGSNVSVAVAAFGDREHGSKALSPAPKPAPLSPNSSTPRRTAACNTSQPTGRAEQNVSLTGNSSHQHQLRAASHAAHPLSEPREEASPTAQCDRSVGRAAPARHASAAAMPAIGKQPSNFKPQLDHQ